MEPTCGPPQATDGKDHSHSPATRSNGRRMCVGSAMGLARFRWGFQRNATQVMPLPSRRPDFGTREVTLQRPVTVPTNCRSRDMVRPVSNMYDLTMTSIEGESVALDQFRDQVCLIVNVASN